MYGQCDERLFDAKRNRYPNRAFQYPLVAALRGHRRPTIYLLRARPRLHAPWVRPARLSAELAIAWRLGMGADCELCAGRSAESPLRCWPLEEVAPWPRRDVGTALDWR